jgi:hypothetical protein
MRKQVNRSVAKTGEWRPLREAQELWDGRQVQVTANGLLPLQVPWTEDPIRLVVGPESRAKIKSCEANRTIHFSKTALSSRLEMMLPSASHIPICTLHRLGSWKTQIGKELVAKGFSTLPTPKETNLPAGTSVNRKAAESRAWFNADRHKELLEVSQVYCTRRHDAKHGTVVLRATLTMKIPQQANFSTVWIKCDLLEPGKVYTHVWTQDTLDGDPAKRLGIRFWYESKETRKMEEGWARMETEWQNKQLNSFVDFLDLKGEEYTESPKRRVIREEARKEFSSRQVYLQ